MNDEEFAEKIEAATREALSKAQAETETHNQSIRDHLLRMEAQAAARDKEVSDYMAEDLYQKQQMVKALLGIEENTKVMPKILGSIHTLLPR